MSRKTQRQLSFVIRYWLLEKEQNAKKLFAHIGTLKPSHIIVTGDLTTTGHEDEFKKAKELLYTLEHQIKSNKNQEQGDQELSIQ